MAQLPHELRRKLIEIAWGAIRSAVSNEPMPGVNVTEAELLEHRGAFVTLRRRSDGSLRGCIGYPYPIKPLWEAVRDAAISAALHDPRFPPVAKKELDELSLEISVLSPMEQVKDVSEIKVGRDGLVVRKGAFAGLLLPQVAVEYNWDRDEFLSHTCIKAGLPPDAWRKGDVEILRFTAEVFGDEELKLQE
ncbi:MAG: AmmeMemoRadiSam system protein A [Armatimonadota bacterium]|nr:AmmeMemoRadiSam system protein A [Armatimonadota bacterium]MCX7777272.1 AmmeMemoRadiSam system protein A [Armatimonadota bacterium]MDW8024686.1 AmmeMemoRadiSam system protein A [Armatimonadota bacterium]